MNPVIYHEELEKCLEMPPELWIDPGHKLDYVGRMVLGRGDMSPFDVDAKGNKRYTRQFISEPHCELFRSEKNFGVIRDLESTNGTYVLGNYKGAEWQKLKQGQEYPLELGLQFRLGDWDYFQFRITTAEAVKEALANRKQQDENPLSIRDGTLIDALGSRLSKLSTVIFRRSK